MGVFDYPGSPNDSSLNFLKYEYCSIFIKFNTLVHWNIPEVSSQTFPDKGNPKYPHKEGGIFFLFVSSFKVQILLGWLKSIMQINKQILKINLINSKNSKEETGIPLIPFPDHPFVRSAAVYILSFFLLHNVWSSRTNLYVF